MYAVIVDASSTNIPTSFSTASGSKIISSAPSASFIGFINTTSDVLAIEIGSYKDTVVPSSSLPGKCGFIPSAPTGGYGSGTIDWFQVTQGDAVFIRATSGSTISSGKLYLFFK